MARLLGASPGGAAIDLTEGNPTRAGLAADPQRLAAALGDPRNVRYEPHPLGLREAREAIARRAGIDADRVVLTASTSEAYSYLFKLCCDPGDCVLVPSPSYPLFDFLARLADVEPSTYPLRLSDDGWRTDVDALAASMPERSRIVLAVSPNNPTGNVLSAREAADLASLARDRELTLVYDEVFADFGWDAPRPSEVLAACEREGALGVVLSGLSKACGLPQLKLGWMLLGGPQDLVEEARARLELVADTYLSVSTPVQHGLPALLEMGDAFRERLRPRIARNLALLRERAPTCGARVLPADAGWYAILALPEGRDEQSITESLHADGVLVHPGWLFDLPLPCLVLSLIVDPHAFDEGTRLMMRVVERRL
jgi:alanine-synthesizing transaminase